MTVTLEQAKGLPIAELTQLSASDLMQVQQTAAETLRLAKELKDCIEGAIALKYADQAKSIRAQLGKDTGTVHFEDDGIHITADLPKKPVWDQKQLTEITERIAEGGDDPAEYVDVTLKISERKYSAWPEYLKNQFAPARTLMTGKPVFKLSSVEGDAV